MRLQAINRGVQLVMTGALLASGAPLLAQFWPSGPLPAAGPSGVDEVGVSKIVVDARDNLTAAQLEALNQKYRLRLDYNSVNARDEKLLISDVAPAEMEGLLAGLRKDPLIEAAEPLHRFSIPPDEQAAAFSAATDGIAATARDGKRWTPNDPMFAKQWNMKLIGAEQAWPRATGKGVVVAVIDTGVAAESDSKCYLAKDFGKTHFTKGYDFVNDDDHPTDDHGHGTHVAGTIAESTNNGEGVAGLAFDASIMPLKVLDGFGSGNSADIADAIRFAADHGAQVINMSLGSSMPDPVMHLACKYAAKKGVLVVCAAGNSGGGAVGYPAAFPECMAVSSVGPSGALAPYSSVGKQVAIAGPGGDTSRSQDGGVLQNTLLDGDPASDGYYGFQGTSMASPHVAAAAALVMSKGVKDAGEVRQILQRAATPKKPQKHFGAGILNASKSIDLAEDATRSSFTKILFALAAALSGVGMGALRGRAGAITRFPIASLGLMIGVLGPDLVFGWLGFSSPFNILLHSSLIPLYLLWEVDGKAVYRFVGAMAFGVALHLGWDAYHGQTPFPGIVPAHALPWLWVNTAVGVGVALVAWRRSFFADGR
jgi:serine protease